MAEPVLFVVNPAAGRGQVGRRVGEIRAVIEGAAQGRAVEVRVTEKPGHGTEIARQAPPGGRVAAVGGDGTVHEVVRAVAGADKTLAVVPIGSGNDFARTLGVRGLGLRDAVRLALDGPVRAVDYGVVNGHPFGSGLGLGFDAAVARKAFTAPAFLRGLPRYLYSIFAVLRELELPELTLEIGGQTFYRGKALLTALMNSPTYGGGIPIVPQARPDDGLLSGAVAGEFSRLGVMGILPKLLQGRHVGHPRVRLFEGERFCLRFDRPVPAHVDGEMLEEASEYAVHLVRGGLRVVGRV